MTSTITDQLSQTPQQRQLIDKDFAIVEQFSRAMIDDEMVDDEVPNGAVLVLLPEDDPKLTEASLQSALDFARLGKNIYI